MKIGNSGAVTSLVRRKAVFWSHLYIKTPSFYQDRLGTNIIGKSQKADRFLTSSLVKKKRKKGQSAAGAAAVDWASEAHPIGEFLYQTFTSGDFNIFLKDFGSRIGSLWKTDPFFSFFGLRRRVVKPEHLPRQARDKHRKKLTKEVVFCRRQWEVA
jgi:hypothetical protein